MSNAVEVVVVTIRGYHRRRRFAIKLQQKVNRSLESFFRNNATTWNPNATEAEREKENRKVIDLIKRIRAGEPHQYSTEVMIADKATEPADEARAANEKLMKISAQELPVYPWVEAIQGAGALGLATIVAESGMISADPSLPPEKGNFPSPSKLWSRLGYAPYDGHAGSTWKRDKWRPRALSADEWVEHPFSGERYALMTQIATWLVNAQWQAAKKANSEDGEGKPTGPYGEIYAARRKLTKKTHPDWTPGHRRSDALRITMKRFLLDLWCEWQRTSAVESAPKQKTKRRTKSTTDEVKVPVAVANPRMNSKDAVRPQRARPATI